MNMNKIDYDEATGILSTTMNYITQIVSIKDKKTLEAIQRYCEENGIIPNIIEKEKLDLVLKLGIEKLNEMEENKC